MQSNVRPDTAARAARDQTPRSETEHNEIPTMRDTERHRDTRTRMHTSMHGAEEALLIDYLL